MTAVTMVTVYNPDGDGGSSICFTNNVATMILTFL